MPWYVWIIVVIAFCIIFLGIEAKRAMKVPHASNPHTIRFYLPASDPSFMKQFFNKQAEITASQNSYHQAVLKLLAYLDSQSDVLQKAFDQETADMLAVFIQGQKDNLTQMNTFLYKMKDFIGTWQTVMEKYNNISTEGDWPYTFSVN